MSCKFFGRRVDPSGVLFRTTGNQCALTSDGETSRACYMDAAGLEVRYEHCEMCGSAAALEGETFQEAAETAVVFTEAPRQQTEPHGLDEKLVELLRDVVKTAAPEDGFAPAMKHHKVPGRAIQFTRGNAPMGEDRYEVERILIYAWGPSADKLAKTLGIAPGGMEHTIEEAAQLPSASPRHMVIESQPEERNDNT